MNIKGIISIAGMPGLYKIVSQTKFGLLVESLADGKRIPTYASQRVSALEDISIFTSGEDMPLKDVFTRIKEKEKGGAAIDPKADQEKLKEYFGTVLPEFDRERVYPSDIKKVISWYNVLQEKNLLDTPEEETSEVTEKEEAPAEKSADAGTKTAAPKKKKTAPKKVQGAAASQKTGSKANAPARAGSRKTGTTRKTGGGS